MVLSVSNKLLEPLSIVNKTNRLLALSMSNINEKTSSESDAATVVETRAGAAKSSSRKPDVDPTISGKDGASSQVG